MDKELDEKVIELSRGNYEVRFADSEEYLEGITGKILNRLLTELKNSQEELIRVGQRYRIVAKLIDEVMFEFNLQNGTMSDSLNWNKRVKGELFLKGTVEKKIVHPDDASAFLEIFTGKTQEDINKVKETILRLKFSSEDTHYHWVSVKSLVLGDRNGKPEKVLGRRTNIDDVKRETEAYRQRAQRDSLTGLYNRGTTEDLLGKLFLERKERNHAVFLFDIDNFKLVNDTQGHPFGDFALTRITEQLTSVFRASDIVGRIGGDEFLVLAADIGNDIEGFIADKCVCALEAIRVLQEHKEFPDYISCSVGISVFPRDGTTYEELVKKADVALYQAKQRGKDQYVIYRV